MLYVKHQNLAVIFGPASHGKRSFITMIPGIGKMTKRRKRLFSKQRRTKDKKLGRSPGLVVMGED